MSGHIDSYILIIMLLAASYFDIRENRIPNIITFSGIILGMIISIINGGFKGLQFSVIGFLFGIAVFFIPFALNLMGAGDVKLMGAIGALAGWKFALSVIVYGAVAGGVIAILIAVKNKRVLTILMSAAGMLIIPVLKRIYNKTLSEKILKMITYFESFRLDNKKKYIPYGVAIAIGTFLVMDGIVTRIV